MNCSHHDGHVLARYDSRSECLIDQLGLPPHTMVKINAYISQIWMAGNRLTGWYKTPSQINGPGWEEAEKFCLMDCRQHYYEILPRTREDAPEDSYYRYELQIERLEGPVMIINYNPKTTLIELISGLGGLLGLWFGLSVFAAYGYYVRLRRIFLKKAKQLGNRIIKLWREKFNMDDWF
jgi:hypothetical protein